MREKLLSHGSDLTLEKAVDIARSHEVAQVQLKTIVSTGANAVSTGANAASQVVHAVSRRTHRAIAQRPAQNKNSENSRDSSNHVDIVQGSTPRQRNVQQKDGNVTNVKNITTLPRRAEATPSETHTKRKGKCMKYQTE